MADELRALHYYKWHWQDWRANRSVQRMSYIEKGIYRELLDECWAEGFIPDDLEHMADIVGCPLEVMADAWQVLSKCFVDIGGGRLVNERLNAERTAKDKERIDRALAGSKGGKAKSLNEKTNEASAKQVPSTCHIGEESRAEESRGEEALYGIKIPHCPHQKIVELYNSLLASKGMPVAINPKLWDGSSRQTNLAARWKEDESRQTLDWWERFFGYIAQSDFLMGRTDGRPFKLDAEWMLKKANFIKILEGRYHG